MNKEQLSIIAAGVVAMLAMAAHDDWITSFIDWVGKKPNGLAPSRQLGPNIQGEPGGLQSQPLVPVPGSLPGQPSGFPFQPLVPVPGSLPGTPGSNTP